MSKFTSTLFKMFEGDLLYWRNPAGAFTIEDKKVDGTVRHKTAGIDCIGNRSCPFYQLCPPFEKH